MGNALGVAIIILCILERDKLNMLIDDRIKNAFLNSKKLISVNPIDGQIKNVIFRLRQLFSEEELNLMDEKYFYRQVERVWPIAKYLDRD
jgi:hypothetical protein